MAKKIVWQGSFVVQSTLEQEGDTDNAVVERVVALGDQRVREERGRDEQPNVLRSSVDDEWRSCGLDPSELGVWQGVRCSIEKIASPPEGETAPEPNAQHPIHFMIEEWCKTEQGYYPGGTIRVTGPKEGRAYTILFRRWGMELGMRELLLNGLSKREFERFVRLAEREQHFRIRFAAVPKKLVTL